jgi:hypothetical protein
MDTVTACHTAFVTFNTAEPNRWRRRQSAGQQQRLLQRSATGALTGYAHFKQHIKNWRGRAAGSPNPQSGPS